MIIVINYHHYQLLSPFLLAMESNTVFISNTITVFLLSLNQYYYQYYILTINYHYYQYFHDYHYQNTNDHYYQYYHYENTNDHYYHYYHYQNTIMSKLKNILYYYITIILSLPAYILPLLSLILLVSLLLFAIKSLPNEYHVFLQLLYFLASLLTKL